MKKTPLKGDEKGDYKNQVETDEFVSEMLEVMLVNLSKGRSSGIAGEFMFRNQEEAKIMHDFYNKKAKLAEKGELINQPTGEGGQLNQAVKGQNVNDSDGGGNSTIKITQGD